MILKETEVTKEMIEKVWRAQLEWAKQHITTFQQTGHMSDDTWDYLRSSLELAKQLTDMWGENDHVGFCTLMNEELNQFACDGICPEIWDMHPLALEELED